MAGSFYRIKYTCMGHGRMKAILCYLLGCRRCRVAVVCVSTVFRLLQGGSKVLELDDVAIIEVCMELSTFDHP